MNRSLDAPHRRPRSRIATAWIGVVVASLALVACADLTPPPVAEDPGTSLTLLGAFVPGAVWNELGGLEELEGALGRQFDLAHWFTSWDHAYDPVPVAAVLGSGRVPLITWQPHNQDVRAIAAGTYDGYIRTWARGIGAADGVVYLRPFPEMNGDWVPWNGDPEGLVAAWRHLTELFEREGVTNVRWVWSPNVTDEPRTDANRLERYYPGVDQVDVLALSGYNWGDTRPHIGWRSFEEIVAQAYPRLAALGPQPVWVAETASAESGGDKATWIRELFATDRFARLEAVVWFNERKETDWRLESSPSSLAAFRDAARTLDAP